MYIKTKCCFCHHPVLYPNTSATLLLPPLFLPPTLSLSLCQPQCGCRTDQTVWPKAPRNNRVIISHHLSSILAQREVSFRLEALNHSTFFLVIFSMLGLTVNAKSPSGLNKLYLCKCSISVSSIQPFRWLTETKPVWRWRDLCPRYFSSRFGNADPANSKGERFQSRIKYKEWLQWIQCNSVIKMITEYISFNIKNFWGSDTSSCFYFFLLLQNILENNTEWTFIFCYRITIKMSN